METQTRPRSKSTFSFRSHKSDQSSGSKPKIDLTETKEEKKRSRFSQKSKVNPNRAINELQPATAQQFQQTTLAPLREVQHKDAFGNTIVDPDRTNPTRPRLERPLDTIRSFEAAIDNRYRQKAQANRSQSLDAVPSMYSRNGSMLTVNDPPPAASRYSPSSIYGHTRASTMTMRGGYEGFGPQQYGPQQYGPQQYGSQQYGPQHYGPQQFGPRRGLPHRMNLPAQQKRMSSDFGVYPVPGYQGSHDTVNTVGESSGSAEQWGYSTDPSSENSSIDRVHAVKPTDSGDAYGGAAYTGNGHGGNAYGRGSPIRGDAIQEETWHGSQHQSSYGPPPPAQNVQRPQQSYAQPPPQQRNVIKLGGGDSTYTAPAAPIGPTYPGAKARPAASNADEKKGWLKRRFSKKT